MFFILCKVYSTVLDIWTINKLLLLLTGNISSRFYQNPEVFAKEFLEETFHWMYMSLELKKKHHVMQNYFIIKSELLCYK